MNPHSILTRLTLAVLIICFLNIHIQTSDDTVSAIWNFIYKSGHKFISLKLISYAGILLLIISALIKHKLHTLSFFIGLSLLWLAVFTFYPYYWSLQREDYLNPQYLFILATIIIIAIKIYEINLIRQKPKA